MSFADAIYLDNAATSFPKPECVYAAVDRYQRENGRPVGRGATDAAQDVQQAVDRCRFRAAQLLGATAKEQIAFTFNCTDSLNLVLHGLLRPGEHVISTVGEHNSVLRPLRQLERLRGVEVSLVGIDDLGSVDSEDVRAAIKPNTRLIVLQHASNVTGIIQPVADVGRIAREHGLLFLVDAAQTAGHLPVDVAQMQADFVACSGHKGLLGPLGTGLLYVAPGRESLVEPLRQGGTGSRSEQETQPEWMPDRFESGNHNAPGLIGLDAALGFLAERTIAAIRAHELQLSQLLAQQLAELPGFKVYSSVDRTRQTGVTSIASDVLPSDELSTILSQHFRIDTRSGLHCAPGIHRRLGTLERQGTVRISFGWSSTIEQVEAVVAALRQIGASVS